MPLSLKGPSDGLPLVVAPTLRHPNGLLPKGDLLQEIPDPLTGISWSGWVELHPATAAKLGVQTGDLVSLDAAPGAVDLPAYVTPSVREGVVAVPIGYAAPLFEDRSPTLAFATRVQVRPTGRKAELFPKKITRSTRARSPGASASRHASSRSHRRPHRCTRRSSIPTIDGPSPSIWTAAPAAERARPRATSRTTSRSWVRWRSRADAT